MLSPREVEYGYRKGPATNDRPVFGRSHGHGLYRTREGFLFLGEEGAVSERCH